MALQRFKGTQRWRDGKQWWGMNVWAVVGMEVQLEIEISRKVGMNFTAELVLLLELECGLLPNWVLVWVLQSWAQLEYSSWTPSRLNSVNVNIKFQLLQAQNFPTNPETIPARVCKHKNFPSSFFIPHQALLSVLINYLRTMFLLLSQCVNYNENFLSLFAVADSNLISPERANWRHQRWVSRTISHAAFWHSGLSTIFFLIKCVKRDLPLMARVMADCLLRGNV